MMDRAVVTKGAQQFIDEVKDSAEFIRFLQDKDEQTWRDLDDIVSNEYQITHGVTKGVVLNDNWDFVLKFDFNIRDTDYCAIEVENYQLAKEAGLEKFFAESMFVEEFCVDEIIFPVYAMELVDCDEEAISDSCYSILKTQYMDEGEEEQAAEDYAAEECSSSDAVEALMYEQWSYKEAEQVQKFCRANNINDLHTGNVGYLNGTLCLVDYSGY